MSAASKHDLRNVSHTLGVFKTPTKDDESSRTMLTPSPTTPIRSSGLKLFSSNIKSDTSEKSQISDSNTEDLNDDDDDDVFNNQASCAHNGIHRDSISALCASATSDDSNDYSDSNTNYYVGANKNNIITTSSQHTNQTAKSKLSNNLDKNSKNREKQEILQNSCVSPKSAFELRYGVKIVGIGESDKPPYSYAAMIGLAILSSEDRRLTLSEIYDWISENFKYYQRSDVGWHNSIRHNLSLNKAFSKTDKSEGKKGHYWQIEPGMESAFLKKKSRKSAAHSSSTSSSANDSNKNNPSMADKKNIFKPNKIKSLKPNNLDNENNTRNKIEKNNGNSSALPPVYQDLTPHSSMTQDEDLELKSLNNAKLLSEVNTNNNSIQKTPKKQIFRIKPDIQHSTKYQKRAFDDSDIEPDFDDNVEVDEAVNKFLNKSPEIFNKKQRLSTPRFSFKDLDILDEPNNTISNLNNFDNEEYSYWNEKGVHYAKTSLSTVDIKASNIFEDSGKLPLNHPLASSFNSNFELSPVKNLSSNTSILDSLETKSNNGNFKSIGINSHSGLNYINNTPNSYSGGSMLLIMKQSSNNTNTSSSSTASVTNIYINYSNSITAHSTANNTPNKIVRTPNSTNRRKIWNTPSYLDDFYTSPSHIKNRLEINKNGQNTPDINGSPFNNSKKRINSPFRSLESNIMGNISTSYNDFFGVDICSVVKRAVKSVVDEKTMNNPSQK